MICVTALYNPMSNCLGVTKKQSGSCLIYSLGLENTIAPSYLLWHLLQPPDTGRKNQIKAFLKCWSIFSINTLI